MCAGSGDRVHAIWALEYFEAMLRLGVPDIELHVYGNWPAPRRTAFRGDPNDSLA